MASTSPERFRFGPFEFDAATGELLRRGVAEPLQAQPARVLARLLRTPGQLVSREEPHRGLTPIDRVDGAFHHVDDGVATSRQLLDALRPGGRLAIVDFASDGPWRRHFRLVRAAHRAGRHGHGVSLDDVRREAQAAGGHVVRQVAGWSGGYHLSVIERAGGGLTEAAPTSDTRE